VVNIFIRHGLYLKMASLHGLNTEHSVELWDPDISRELQTIRRRCDDQRVQRRIQIFRLKDIAALKVLAHSAH